MKHSLSEKEKRLSGKPWQLQKWQPAAGKSERGGGEIYGHASPNGNSLLIDRFQLKADLQVNMEKFHQVLGFQHVREKWKKSALPSILKMIRRYQFSEQKRTHVFIKDSV